MSTFIEIIIQTILAFFGILFITRLLGRQQVAQLTFYEYINGITFGSIAGNMATDLDQHTYQHFVGLLLFGALTFFVSFITLKKRNFSKVIEGEPVIVIQNGNILEKNLGRMRYSIDELNILLRQKDIFSIDDVEYGLLEVNGNLSVILKKDKQTVTKGDLNIKEKEDSLHTEIVIGGQLIYENLRKKNLNGKELLRKLKKFNVKSIDEIMYLSIDDNGEIYIDKYKDNLKKEIDISENNENI